MSIMHYIGPNLFNMDFPNLTNVLIDSFYKEPRWRGDKFLDMFLSNKGHTNQMILDSGDFETYKKVLTFIENQIIFWDERPTHFVYNVEKSWLKDAFYFVTDAKTRDSWAVSRTFQNLNFNSDFIFNNIDIIMGFIDPYHILSNILSDYVEQYDFSTNGPFIDKIKSQISAYVVNDPTEVFLHLNALGLRTCSSITPFIMDIIDSTITAINKSSAYGMNSYFRSLLLMLSILSASGVTMRGFKTNSDVLYDYFYVVDDGKKAKMFATFKDLKSTKFIGDKFLSSLFPSENAIMEFIDSDQVLGKNKNLEYYIKNGYKINVNHIANAMNVISPWFNDIYDRFGVDALIRLLKNDRVKTLFSVVSSGKRLLDRSQNMEEILLNIMNNNPSDIDRVFDAIPDNISKGMISAMVQKIAVLPVIEEMYSDDNPMKPSMQLDSSRIRDLLKYNDFSFDQRKVRRKKNESHSSYLQRVEKEAGKDIPKINMTKIEETQDQKYEKTVEYLKYYNNMHGNTAVEFLETYDVEQHFPQ